MIGRNLAHYKIQEKLGSGGMGEVYLAWDERLGRDVALKLLPSGMTGRMEWFERFQREIHVLASLNHPNITTIYSVEEARGFYFFTMEVVEGELLSQIIRPSGVTLDRFFELALQIVDAVRAAHRKQIIHRDLKPGNVLVSAEGRVKVFDFGLAKIRRAPSGENDALRLAEDTALTEEGRVLGTGPYMSPEQVKGQSADLRSDVFTLGILLHEILTGKRPFEGSTRVRLLAAILREAPELATSREGLPEQLANILQRCLEKDPGDRYENAGELYEELIRLKKEREVRAILESGVWPASPQTHSRNPLTQSWRVLRSRIRALIGESP